MYAKRKFVVTAILIDPKFKHLENFLNKSGEHIGYIVPNGNLVESSINVTVKNEHVKEVERNICTVKEGTRSMHATILMFQKIP